MFTYRTVLILHSFETAFLPLLSLRPSLASLHGTVSLRQFSWPSYASLTLVHLHPPKNKCVSPTQCDW